MKIPVDTQVTFTVKNIQVSSIIVRYGSDGRLTTNVPYQWLDADGKVLKAANVLLSEDQLVSNGMGDYMTTFKAMLAAPTLFMVLTIAADDAMSAVYWVSTIVNGTPQSTSTKHDAAGLDAMLKGAGTPGSAALVAAIGKAIVAIFNTNSPVPQ